jgi:hypothetical protein
VGSSRAHAHTQLHGSAAGVSDDADVEAVASSSRLDAALASEFEPEAEQNMPAASSSGQIDDALPGDLDFSPLSLPDLLPHLPLISPLSTLPLQRLLANVSATPDDVWHAYVSLMRGAPRGSMLPPNLLRQCIGKVARPGAGLGGREGERRKEEEDEELLKGTEEHNGDASLADERSSDAVASSSRTHAYLENAHFDDAEEEALIESDGLLPAGASPLTNQAALRVLALLGALERGLSRARDGVLAARHSTSAAAEAAAESSGSRNGSGEAEGPSAADGHPVAAAYLAALNAPSTRRAVLSALTRARRGVAGEEVTAALSWLNRVQRPARPAASKWSTRRFERSAAAPDVLEGRLIDGMLDLVARSVNAHSMGLSLASTSRDAVRTETLRTMQQVAHLRLELPPATPRKKKNRSSPPATFELPQLEAQHYDTPAAARLFAHLWPRSRAPTLRAWGSYLALEIRLAAQRRRIRAAYPLEASRAGWDSWAPVRAALARIADADALHVSHVNAAMYGAMRWRPSDGLEEDWPSWNDVQTTYTALRSNLLQAEMRRAMFGLPAPLRPQQSAPDESNAQLLPSALRPMPAHVMPTHTTYTLLLTLATRQGDFAGMLDVLHDLTSTELDAAERAQRWQLAELRGQGAMAREAARLEQEEEEGEREKMQPSLADFDAIFRGFAKHALPSRFDVETSSWVPNEEAAAAAAPHQQAWTMSAFLELLDLFLDCSPRAAYAANERAEAGASHAPSAPLWRAHAERHRVHRSSSTTAAAPPPKALFFLLTAMRRVSGDDAKWVLQQWQDVEDKFTAHDEGWRAWRPNIYTRNALELLQRRAEA